jgi:hypothetical protein
MSCPLEHPRPENQRRHVLVGENPKETAEIVVITFFTTCKLLRMFPSLQVSVNLPLDWPPTGFGISVELGESIEGLHCIEKLLEKVRRLVNWI